MEVVFSGPETGVGNVMDWMSEHPSVGNGRQEIREVVENERVQTTLNFGERGMAESWWLLVEEGQNTRVRWGLEADMGAGPVGRWIGLMMDRMVGPDYELGLARLRTLVEG